MTLVPKHTPQANEKLVRTLFGNSAEALYNHFSNSLKEQNKRPVDLLNLNVKETDLAALLDKVEKSTAAEVEKVVNVFQAQNKAVMLRTIEDVIKLWNPYRQQQ